MTIAIASHTATVHDPEPAGRSLLVWDVAVRTFHWSLVAAVATAWVTGGGGSRVHEIAGSAVAALVLFRLIWGVAGTRHARFAAFVRGPAEILRETGRMLHGRPTRHVGHNPVGSAMIVALLAVLTVIVVTGFMMQSTAFFGIAWVEDAHHHAANALLLLVPLHVVGAIISSLLERENLVRAMFTGFKARIVAAGAARSGHDERDDRDELLTRLRGSQGLSLLLFLLAGGIAAGWVTTSGRTSVAVATAPPTQLAVITQTPVLAKAPTLPSAPAAPLRDHGTNPALPRDMSSIDTVATPATGDLRELRAGSDRSRDIAAREVRLRGRLTALWSLDGVAFRVDRGTRIDKSPMVGDTVEVRGYVTGDSAINATRVRRR